MSSQQKLLICGTEAAELLDLTKQQLYEHSRSRITHKLRQHAGALAILLLGADATECFGGMEGRVELLC
jgi:hypothetical protein